MPTTPAPAPAASNGNGNSADKGADGNQDSAKPAKPSKGADKPAKPTVPMGNNGTVKIAPYGAVDGIPNNTPHVGCTFQVEWYGLDEGSDIVSQVSFAEHAPTLDVGMQVSGPASVFVGGDPATGAGTDSGLDGVAVYTLSFDGAPHPKQGYHVKLTINTPRSHGNDSKTKVFWVEGCAPTAPVPGPSTTPGTTEVQGSSTTPGTTKDQGTSTPQVLGEQATAETTTGTTPGTTPAAVEVLGVQANTTRGQAARNGAQLPTAIAAGAHALGLQTPVERSLFGLLLMLLGAAFGGFVLTRRSRV